VSAGLILAAGASRRLGTPKQLVPLGGRPLLTWIIDSMREYGPDQIVVVLGHHADSIIAQVDLSGIDIVVNERYLDGMSTSLKAGISALRAEHEYAIVATGDQPFVPAAHFRALEAARNATGQPIIATAYRDYHGVPLLMCRETWRLVEGLSGDQGARPLLRTHKELVATVPSPDDNMAIDVDTPAAFAQAHALVTARLET
jgi:molybdenum cofactor cytidylyltransferase